MRTTTRALTLLAIVALTLTGALRDRASAGGGSWLTMEREWYEPGDRASGWANVGWTPDVDGPERGPFYIWIVTNESLEAAAREPVLEGIARRMPRDAIRVARVQIHEEPYDDGFTRFGPHHVIVDFIMPNLPPGEYQLVPCNDPCTASLGDFTGGWLRIGPPEATLPAPVSPAPTLPTPTLPAPTARATSVRETPAAATAPDAESGVDALPVLLGAGLLALAVLAVTATRRRQHGKT